MARTAQHGPGNPAVLRRTGDEPPQHLPRGITLDRPQRQCELKTKARIRVIREAENRTPQAIRPGQSVLAQSHRMLADSWVDVVEAGGEHVVLESIETGECPQGVKTGEWSVATRGEPTQRRHG